ncbi:MAG: glycoside hydrolase family 16 protein [Bacteroidales bacterium]|nr:glycoside hydrolase family 16 protein [Bacteroidales bacterium]
MFFPTLGQNSPQDKNWDTVFQDDFSTFNTSLWYKAHNHVHGDSTGEEPQVYIQDDAYINYIDGSNKLVLRTRKLNSPYQWTNPSQHCPKGNNCWYSNNHYYTSGQISSNILYKYGYFEIYAKLPSGTVFWPAFWLWNANKIPPNCFYNEIDIMEANGCEPNWVSSNFQATFDCEERDRDAIHHTCNYSDGNYHWFGVEWNRDKITWYVDRVSVRQIPNNLWGIGIQNPLVIIINLALFPPSWNKCLLDTTLFPAYMYIDYVNIYHLKEDRTGIINACNYNFDLYDNRVKRNITIGGQGCGNTIENGKNITLRAAEFIQINGEFTVEPGAEFYMDVNEFY